MNLSLNTTSALSSTNFLANLGLNPEELFQDKHFLVVEEEGDVDGSFVLQILLAEFAKTCGGPRQGQVPGKGQDFGIGDSSKLKSGKRKSLLVLNTQTESHWNSVASKLGWNLTLQKDKGQIAVVDLLKLTFDAIVQESHSQYEEISNSHSKSFEFESDFFCHQKSGQNELNKLLSKCSAEIDRICSQEKDEKYLIFIVIENLSNIFNYVGDSDKLVLEFVQKLRFLERKLSNIEICIATLVSSSNSDQSGTYFSKTLSHLLANYTFFVRPLQTGFSSQVDGTISVEKSEKNIFSRKERMDVKSLVKNSSKIYHYKLEDRNVRVIPL